MDNPKSVDTVDTVGVAILLSPEVPSVALVVEMETFHPVPVSVPRSIPVQLISQIPAVKLIEVIFAAIPLDKLIADPWAIVARICSPKKPADGAVPALNPTIVPPDCVVVLFNKEVPVYVTALATIIPEPVI